MFSNGDNSTFLRRAVWKLNKFPRPLSSEQISNKHTLHEGRCEHAAPRVSGSPSLWAATPSRGWGRRGPVTRSEGALPRVTPRAGARVEVLPGLWAPGFSHDATLLPGFQFEALGSGFYGPGFRFSFRRLWEKLDLSTGLGTIITVLTGEDLGVLLGHIKCRGRPWKGGPRDKQNAPFTWH